MFSLTKHVNCIDFKSDISYNEGMKKISIVTPMYNESAMVDKYFEAVAKIADENPNYGFEFVVVNDGSKDDTYDKILAWTKKRNDITAVCLSRNFGQEPAVWAGIGYASGDAAIVMDCDMQDPPELVTDLIAKWEEGFDVVNAKRVDRSVDSAFQRNTAKFYYKTLNKLSYKVKYPENVNNFRLVSRRVIDTVTAYPSKEKLFRNAVAQAGFKTAEVEFVRNPRLDGESHVNAKSMVRLSLQGIADAGVKPLDYSFFTSIVFMIIGGLLTLAAVVLAITDACGVFIRFVHTPLFLVLTVISTAILICGVLLLFIGILSFYTGKTYTEVKARPMFTVSEVVSATRKSDEEK